MTHGQPFVGTDAGPSMLREKGLRNILTSLGWRVEDMPDLDFDAEPFRGTVDPPNARNCSLVAHGSEKLADIVEEKLRGGNFPLILGGDHSIGIGSLTGILRVVPDIGIIWVDAHADLNTPATSDSGNMHGMPLGLLLDHPKESAVDFLELPGFDFLVDGPRISPDQIVYVGLRDIDPTERIWIKKYGIKAFTMYDIDHYGIGQVMDKTFDHLLKDNPDRPLHLSYDIDAVDPILAPATGTKVRGGLTYREAHFVAEAVAQSGNLASAEIVELNPTLSDDSGAYDTVELGEQLVSSFMGKSII
jgi:arginase